MKLKYLIIPAMMLSIALSGSAIAKKPEGKGNPHAEGPDARWENSNKQSGEYSLKGQERADERHRAKESDKHKYNKQHGKYNRRDKDEYYDHDEDDDRYEGKPDRYERQRYKERYQNNPIDRTIDRNVNDAKSIIDNAHRKTIESIDNKSRELMGDESKRDRTKSARPWWSIFGNE